MKEVDPRSDTFALDERQRRFQEDLIDAYDEEVEMEVDDRLLDGPSALSPEARAARKYGATEFEGTPPGIVLRGIDFRP